MSKVMVLLIRLLSVGVVDGNIVFILLVGLVGLLAVSWLVVVLLVVLLMM